MPSQRLSSLGLLRTLHLSVPGPLSASGGPKTTIPQHLFLSPLWAEATPAPIWGPLAQIPAAGPLLHTTRAGHGSGGTLWVVERWPEPHHPLGPVSGKRSSLLEEREALLPSSHLVRPPHLLPPSLNLQNPGWAQPRGRSQGPQRTRCFQTLRPRPWERFLDSEYAGHQSVLSQTLHQWDCLDQSG